MQKIKLFKGTVNEIASDPPFKSYKSDSQRYPLFEQQSIEYFRRRFQVSVC